MSTAIILKEPFTKEQIKQWDENLLQFLKDMNEWEEESKKIDFIIGHSFEPNPCQGCSNQGKVCHCTLGQKVIN